MIKVTVSLNYNEIQSHSLLQVDQYFCFANANCYVVKIEYIDNSLDNVYFYSKDSHSFSILRF